MAARHLEPGTLIAGKYLVRERLGGGGMGEVYRAEHVLAGRVVALKLLKRDYAEDADLTRRFFQEAQAVNRIRHPNIVDVLDADVSDLGPYVVMECLEGTTLGKALARDGRFELGVALSVLLPVLAALDAAHRAGIVHRDLKPENIFLARTGESANDVRIKLVDFGIAKVLDAPTASSPKTHTGVIYGTPDYLSPEQATGEGMVDGRSDVFSVGTLLFEVLTGQRPFEAKNAIATAYRIVNQPAPTLASLGIEVDGRVQEALDRALAKRADDRFQAASSFADMLAPLVPDAAARRGALRALLDGTTPRFRAGPPSTIAPPRPAPSPEPVQSPPPAPVRSAPPPPVDEDPPRDASPRPATVEPPLPPATKRVAEAPRSAASRFRSRALPSAVRGRWWPRPLPPHVTIGTPHVRGSMARAICAWLERAFGESVRADLERILPGEAGATYRADAFNSIIWYDLEVVDTLIEAAGAALLGGDTAIWRDLALENFERDFGVVFRPLQRPTEIGEALRRAPAGWSRLLDFVELDVKFYPDLGRASIRFERFDPMSLAFREIVIGTTLGLAASVTRTEPTARVVAGDASFAHDLEFELVGLDRR